ncbi:hypothetical protein V0288_23720 [Pannus brasiliensis CCIBt3594]|uniref:Homing endonuclease LAGLIDADG domain-containing protein n=1 Tax=Pannus brasiliensis CCIBt3594 TaxID=1427578 RepID=A0AAW9R1Y0_9CHRO
MYQLNLCDRALILLSESGERRWPVNPRDRVRRRFLFYLAGNNKAELKKVCQYLDRQSFEIRPTKRLKNYKWECKIEGMAWNDALELAISMGADLSACVPIDLKNRKVQKYRNYSIEALEAEKIRY